MATNDRGYYDCSDMGEYIVSLRAKLAAIPNLPVLVSQEIWGLREIQEGGSLVIMDKCKEATRSMGSRGAYVRRCDTRDEDRRGQTSYEDETIGEQPAEAGNERDVPDRSSNRGFIQDSLSHEDLREMVRYPSVEFDLDIFYRILEEYLQQNNLCP